MELVETDPFQDLRRVAFISPHPDDVELCCGILIKRLIRCGLEVSYLCVTDGAPVEQDHVNLTSLPPNYDREAYKFTRRQETTTALEMLGVEPEYIEFLDYPDLGTLNHINSIVENFGAVLKDVDGVFCCPFEGSHPDHDICRFALAVSAPLNAYSGRMFEYASYNARGYEVFLKNSPADFAIIAEPDEEQFQKRVAEVFVSQKEMATQFKTTIEYFRRVNTIFKADQFLAYEEAADYEQFAFPGSYVLDKIREYLLLSSGIAEAPN
jgi:LmbE family N-acetylglucosaminyl deacetylase